MPIEVSYYRGIFAILAGLGPAITAQANMPVPPNMFFCANGSRSLTIYESSSPRIFDQNLVLRNSGTYWVSVEASGFTFEGHAYARRSNFNKWSHIAKTSKGERKWTRKWHVSNFETEAYLRLQLVKDDNNCSGCTLKLKVRSTCENS